MSGQSQQPAEAKQQRIYVSRTDRHPLREWSIYAGITVGTLSFVAGRLVITALWADRTGLCLTIFVLFGAAAVKNFFDILYVHKQTLLTEKQITELVRLNDVVKFLKTAKEGILYLHVKNLYEIGRRDSQISQDNLIVLLQSKLNSKTRLTDISSGLLVTLGLIGTVIGLIVAVGGVAAVVDSVGEDKSQVLAGLNDTLGGMGTAFYTTLLGAILGGIVLRLLGSVVDNHVDHLVARIAELSEVYIVPTLRKAARKSARSEDQLAELNKNAARNLLP